VVCYVPEPISSFALDVCFLLGQKEVCLSTVPSMVLSWIIVYVKAVYSFFFFFFAVRRDHEL